MPRILLIDDDTTLRSIVAKSLAYDGHEVVQASDGKQGVELSRVAAFDLVITDLVMPVQEGVETIIMLRREQPKLPIIAISGDTTNSPLYLKIAGNIGANRIIGKPFTPKELSDAIKDILGGAKQPA